MTEPSPPSDGLTEAQRVLFGLYVESFVGAAHELVRERLGWTDTDEDVRYRGKVPFADNDLVAIVEEMSRQPGHVAAAQGPNDIILRDVRDAFRRGEPGTAEFVAEKIRAPEGKDGEPIPASGSPAVTEAATDPQGQEPSVRITEILMDPRQAEVVLPAAVFGLLVGLPLLHHLRPFTEDTSVSMTWLLILGAGLWAVLNVLGLDGVMRGVLERGVFQLPPIAKVHRAFDAAGQRRVGLERWRESGIGALPDRTAARDVRLILAKADTCDRLAVWLVIATPLTCLALWHTTWPRVVYPLVLLLVAPTLLLSALDHRRRATEIVEGE